MAKQKKFYVVWEGHNPGVYNDWAKTQLQIKGFPNAKFKSFSSRSEAEAAYLGNYQDYVNRTTPKAKPRLELLPDELRTEINWESIAVDAACGGNPGKMEYRGVELGSGLQLFHKSFPLGTNNIGEFLAIVHALAYFAQTGEIDRPIYTDSRNAINWVRAGKARTSLVKNARTADLHEVIKRAEKWLATHTFKNPILKWKTERWGEIPADFGRK